MHVKMSSGKWRPSCLGLNEAETKGRRFVDDIFKCIFAYENYILIQMSLKCVPRGSNEHYASIGSDNGLVPNRRQAIIWTNDGLVYWRICVSIGLSE